MRGVVIFKDLGGNYGFQSSKPIYLCGSRNFVITMMTGRQWMATAQTTDDLTPGMLFGPLYVSDGQRYHSESQYSSTAAV